MDSEFGRYFEENWDNMRDSWTQFSRLNRYNHGNCTNNRLESYHSKLKLEAKQNAPLDVMFRDILLVIKTLDSRITHRMFYGMMRSTVDPLFPDLKAALTPFAYKHGLVIF